MSEKHETRLWPAEELRIVEDEGAPTRIEGMAAPYGTLSNDLGGFRERILFGAFDEVLRSGEDLIIDQEHDHVVLARSSKGTARFESRTLGLFFSFDVPDTQRGRDALEDVRIGNKDGMSVAWLYEGTIDQWQTEDGQTVREIIKAPLTGASLTYRPAYEQTVNTLVVRSLEQWEADRDDWQIQHANRRRRLDLERKALRDG